MVEFLHALKEKPRALFATHYHELTELAAILERVRNYHIAVKEWQDNVIFLHKIMPGPTDQSFGIHVAKIAGIPRSRHREGQGHPAQPGEEGAEPPGQGAHHRPHREGAGRRTPASSPRTWS